MPEGSPSYCVDIHPADLAYCKNQFYALSYSAVKPPKPDRLR